MNFLVILAASTALANAQASERYMDCLHLVEADLELGRKAAQQWVSEGGGAEARHCLAIADIAAGFLKLGAARLENIAARKDAGDDYVRARLLAQSASTWLRADEIERADAAIKAAFALTPDAGELHVTAAKIHAAKNEWQQVFSSVEIAEQTGFSTVSNFLLRARAYMALGNYEAAALDVVQALQMDPTNIEALTLRGDIQLTGVPIDVYYEGPEAQKKP